MKVLNLQCAGRHDFEGWFASEGDFQDQLLKGLVGCPMCGDTAVRKMPSAPRLNLSGARHVQEKPAHHENAVSTATSSTPATDASSPPGGEPAELAQLRAKLWQAARQMVASAEDVGDRFADEARRIHHGDAEERGIRGQASGDEVRALIEEGIGILPVPDALKETLQ